MAQAGSEFSKTNAMMTRSEFKVFLHETRSGFAQSNPKRKRASNPSDSVKDLRLKRVSVDVDGEVESDVQDDSEKSRLSDVNLGIQSDSERSDIVPQEMNSDGLSNKNLVDVNVEQSSQISNEVKLEKPNENKLGTPLCPRSKLVENSSSVSFRRLLPYLKNLTEDESSGIKICRSYDRSSSNNEQILLQNINVMGGFDGVRMEASNEVNACRSFVNKTGISSSLQSRLIGNLNSPSYKRLLPYLNGLAKDDSSNINNCDSYCNLEKAENKNEIHLQFSDKHSHSVVTGNAVDNFLVDDKDPILEINSSYSLEVPRKLINEELNVGQIDETSIENQKGVNDSGINDAEIFEESINYNTDIGQSTSDADIFVDRPVVNDKNTILEGNSSYSLDVPQRPINEELNNGQIDEISMEDQKVVNDLTKTDAEILEKSINYNTDIVQSSPADANIPMDDKDTLIERNSSYSLEVTHKPINEELNDRQIDDISMKHQKRMNDLSRNETEILEVSANYSTDVQSTSPDANILNCKDSFQSTPPDADMVNKLDEKYISESSPPDINFSGELNAVDGRRVATLVDNSMAKKNFSPVSCSRPKLYRNSSSFSYRRLLPYLTSLAKTETNGLDVIHMAKAEIGLGEKPVVVSDDIPLTAEHNHTHSSTGQNLKKNHISDLDSTSVGNNQLCDNSQVENLTSDVILTESPKFEFEMVQKSLPTTATSSDLSLDELSGGAMDMDEEHFKEVSTGKNGRNQVFAPKKGILKKNPGGCKGMCMCLDCELYRVNAEKAFEFSRKQMLHANEVVEGLIKESSCLRKTMERSVVTMVNGSESYAVLQVDQKQVKGVCQRAHKVEEQAKSSMRQMFSDLNNHCRSPGPRVTFLDAVREKGHP